MTEPTAPETSSTTASGAEGFTAEEFVQKLTTALKRDGDFPASAKVVAELRQLVSDPKTTANQITEVILKEPSLGTRVLHLVNSSFYRRVKPIMTVSQAVVQIGMKPLAELCAGLVLMQKFIPAARRGGVFASCLQKTILTSLLSSSITTEVSKSRSSKNTETGYLAGSFAEIGPLLLAYYFPQVYENALKRSTQKKTLLSKSIQEITGLSPTQLSIEVVKALDLPEFYRDVLLGSLDTRAPLDSLPPDKAEAIKMGRSLSGAQQISEGVVSCKSKQELDQIVARVGGLIDLPGKSLNDIIGELPNMFKGHCSSLELQLPTLPDFVASYSGEAAVPQEPQPMFQKEDDKFKHFVDEIKQAIDNGEPTVSIITSVMETFAWSLGFDRVLLLLIGKDRKKLVGRMLLGTKENFDPKSFERNLAREYSNNPDCQAFLESRPVFRGEPIFEDGWPFTTIPIGFGQRAIGVIYADRVSSESVELTGREQAAIGVLAELLDRSVVMQH